jgi:hypothetical protein
VTSWLLLGVDRQTGEDVLLDVSRQIGEDRIGNRLCRYGLTWPCSLTSDELRVCLLLTRYPLILLLSF